MSLPEELLVSLANILAVIAVVVVLITVAWFVLRRFVRGWKSQFIDCIGEIQSALRRVKDRIDHVAQAAQDYSPTDQEPYGSVAKALQQSLTQARAEHGQQTQQLNYLCQNVIATPEGRLARLWFGFWAEPRHHWQRYRAAERLQQTLQASRGQLDQAVHLLEKLQSIPLEVAQRSQALYRIHDQIAQITETLSACGLQGQLLDSVVDEVKQLEARLRNLPVYFFQESIRQIIQESDKQSTMSAWQTLAEIEAPAQKYLEQFQRWQTLHQEVGQTVQRMQQMARLAHERLDAAPPTVEIRSFVGELEQVDIEVETLLARYHSPTLEVLEELTERVLGVTETAKWLVEQLNDVTDQFNQLHANMILNADLLAQITLIMETVVEIEQYPLDWQQSHIELDHLRELEARIGSIESLRTPPDLVEHLQQAEVLGRQAQLLKNRATEIQTQRDKLRPLLQRSELAAQPAWLVQAKNLQQRIAKYEAKNWPKEDEVKQIDREANRLAHLHKALQPTYFTEPFVAEQLGLYLADVQAFIAAVETFQARLQRVEESLTALQQLEQAAQYRLEMMLHALELLLKRLKSVEVSLLPPLLSQQQQSDKLSEEGHQLALALEKRKTGLVKDKDQQITEWVERGVAVLQTLQDTALGEVKNINSQLHQEIKALQMVAPFSRERAMQEAQRLLQQVTPPVKTPLVSPPEPQQLELVVAQIDRLLQTQADLQKSFKTVVTQISDRVNGSHQAMQQARQEALLKVESLSKTRSMAESNWPPATCHSERAKQLLDEAERDFKGLKKATTTAEVLSRLTKLTERYQAVAREANEKLAEIRQQQHHLQDILDRIDYWRRQLETFGELHRQDAAIREAITERLKIIDTKLADARRSQRSASQVALTLRELWQMSYQNLWVKRDKTTETISIEQIEAV